MSDRFGHRAEHADSLVRGRRRRVARGAAAGGLLALVVGLAAEGDAEACGACYASSSEVSVVEDHKMVFAIQKQRTVLWDQIVYSGNPSEFAYVIPAKPGTRLEPSSAAWFSALDASTRPILMAPRSSYGGGGYGDEGAGGGCCSSTITSSMDGAGSAGAGSRETVQVLAESVVGPYETVTIRSTEPEALRAWLVAHGYAVPDASGPIIASYVAAGLDFIALRLQPGKGVRAMEPIRIVSPGTDAQLPLRMMQIGAGARLGITLYVVGEGRYRTASFPEAAVDFTKLIWDYTQSRSNYQELSLAAMASQGGRAFVTEYADRPSFDASATAPSGAMASNLGLAAAYRAACPTYGEYTPPGPGPAVPAHDAGGDLDAAGGVDAAADPDAGADLDAGADADAGGDGDASVAHAPDAGKPVAVATCDDLDVAVDGFALNDVRLTRLRANLPNAALADTLRLEPAPTQERFENVHYAANTGSITTARVARLRASREQGTWVLIGLTALVLGRTLRRRPR